MKKPSKDATLRQKKDWYKKIQERRNTLHQKQSVEIPAENSLQSGKGKPSISLKELRELFYLDTPGF